MQICNTLRVQKWWQGISSISHLTFSFCGNHHFQVVVAASLSLSIFLSFHWCKVFLFWHEWLQIIQWVKVNNSFLSQIDHFEAYALCACAQSNEPPRWYDEGDEEQAISLASGGMRFFILIAIKGEDKLHGTRAVNVVLWCAHLAGASNGQTSPPPHQCWHFNSHHQEKERKHKSKTKN